VTAALANGRVGLDDFSGIHKFQKCLGMSVFAKIIFAF